MCANIIIQNLLDEIDFAKFNLTISRMNVAYEARLLFALITYMYTDRYTSGSCTRVVYFDDKLWHYY